MARITYRNVSDWTTAEERVVTTPEGETARIVVECCDIAEPSGYRFAEGRWRVRVVGPGTGWPRARTLTGETAHNDAHRLVWDLETQLTYRGR